MEVLSALSRQLRDPEQGQKAPSPKPTEVRKLWGELKNKPPPVLLKQFPIALSRDTNNRTGQALVGLNHWVH